MLKIYQTAEVAALVSAHSQQLIESPTPVPQHLLQEYWRISQNRSKRWQRLFAGVTDDDHHALVFDDGDLPEEIAAADLQPVSQQQLEETLEEIFVTEILTRVWTAILTVTDRVQQINHGERIARHVLICHLQARHQAMRLMVNDSQVSLQRLAKIDQLRRRTERWTDLLLGPLAARFDVAEFAFEPHRMLDFADEFRGEPRETAERPSWNYILAGLRLAFPRADQAQHDMSHEQQALIDTITACWPDDAFSTFGPLASEDVVRIRRSGQRGDRRYSAKGDWQQIPQFREPQASPPTSGRRLKISDFRFGGE